MRRFLAALILPLVLVAAPGDARLPFGGIAAPVSDPIATLAATWSHNTWHSACPQDKFHCGFASLISSSYYTIAEFDPAVADASTGLCYTTPCKASGSGQWASDAAVAAGGGGGSGTGVNPGALQQWSYTFPTKSPDGRYTCMTGGGHAIGADGSIYCIDLATAAQNILNSSGASGGAWTRSLASGRLIDACAVPAWSAGCSGAYTFTETVPAWVHVASTPGPTRAKEAYIEVESPGPLQQKMGNFFTHSYTMATFLPGHVFVPGGVFTVDTATGGCCVGGVFPFHVDTGRMDAAAPIFVAAGASVGQNYDGTKNGLAQGTGGDGVGFPIAVCGDGSVIATTQGAGGATILMRITNPATAGLAITYSVATADVFNPPADSDALCVPDPVNPSHYGMFFQEAPGTFVYFSSVDTLPQTTCTTMTAVKCWENQAFSGTVPAPCSAWSYSGLSGFSSYGLAYDSTRGKIAYNQGDGHICEITLGANPALWSVSELTSTPTGDVPGNPDLCGNGTGSSTPLPRMAYDATHDLFVVDICGGEWWYKP